MKTTKLFILWIIIFTTIAGCKKETNIASENGSSGFPEKSYPITSEIKLLDGRLYFQDRAQFNAIIERLSEYKDLDGFEQQFQGYTSNRMAFEKIDDLYLDSINYNLEKVRNYAILLTNGNDSTLERVVFIDCLSALFNSQGVLQIGDTIYKFTYSFTLKFHKNLIQSVPAEDIKFNTPNVISFNNVRNNLQTYNIEASMDECETKYDKNKKKLKGELNDNRTYLYNALTADTKSRKKGLFGIGFAYRVNKLTIDAYGYHNWWYPPEINNSYFHVWQTRYNATDVQETIAWSAGLGVPYPVFVSANGTHTLKEKSSSPTLTCTTQY